MAKSQSLQEPFLNTLRREHIPVSIYLRNGIKLQGQIDSFDNFVVLLKNNVSAAEEQRQPAGLQACHQHYRAHPPGQYRPGAEGGSG